MVAGKDRQGTLKGHKELIEAATFYSVMQRMLASVGWDTAVRVWDVEKGEESAVMKGHKRGDSFHRDIRRRQTTCLGQRTGIQIVGRRKARSLLADLGGENAGAKFVTLSPDGAWLGFDHA